MRYGKTNAIEGSFELLSSGFGFGDGGGSISVYGSDLGLTIDSGRALIASPDEVSMVICTGSVVGFRGA